MIAPVAVPALTDHERAVLLARLDQLNLAIMGAALRGERWRMERLNRERHRIERRLGARGCATAA